MKFLKKICKTIISYFHIKESPIGLKSLGIKNKYLEKFNNFCYNKIRFSTKTLSPVKIPYYLK